MRNQEIQLYLILNKLRLTPKKTDDGIYTPHWQYVQNIIYLLQCCGVGLNYEFKWNNNMPYSRDLRDVYYDLKSSLDAGYHDYSWYKLSDAENQVAFEACNSVLVNPKSVGVDETEWAKFLSVIDYLHHSPQRPNTIKDDDVKKYIDSLYQNRIEKYDFCYKLAALRLDNMYAITA